MLNLYKILFLSLISRSFQSITDTNKEGSLRIQKGEKPYVCTFIHNKENVSRDLIDFWKKSWENYGWNTKILTDEDAKSYDQYERFVSESQNLTQEENSLHFKYMALSSLYKLRKSSFYAELTVFPLHPFVAIPSPPSRGPYSQGHYFQSYDSHSFSMMHAYTGMGWKHTTDFLLTNTTEEAHTRLRKISDFTSQVIHVNLELYKKDLMKAISRGGKIIKPLKDACKLTKTHLAIRFDGDAVYLKYMKYFMTYLVNFCVHDTAQVKIQSLESHFSHFVHDFSDSTLHRTSSIGNAIQTRTEIICDNLGVGCNIKNACVNNEGGITMFGDWDHYIAVKDILRGKLKQSYKCPGCIGNVPVKLAESEIFDSLPIRDSIATMGVGIANPNCGHHLGDVILPLTRLNLKFRKEEEVTSLGIGSLFVEANQCSCEKLYLPIASEIIRYNQIPTETPMCFKNILVGTRNENYSAGQSSRNRNFIRDLKAFRSMYYKRYNIDYENQIMDTIIIIQKRSFSVGHLTNIRNIQDILDMLEEQEYTKRYKVHILSWEDYSVKAQLDLLARTRLMISLPGAAEMNAVFLQNSAALIGYCRPTPSGPYKKGIEFSYWFDHLHYFEQFHEYCSRKEMKIEGKDVIVNIDVLKQHLLKINL